MSICKNASLRRGQRCQQFKMQKILRRLNSSQAHVSSDAIIFNER